MRRREEEKKRSERRRRKEQVNVNTRCMCVYVCLLTYKCRSMIPKRFVVMDEEISPFHNYGASAQLPTAKRTTPFFFQGMIASLLRDITTILTTQRVTAQSVKSLGIDLRLSLNNRKHRDTCSVHVE
jgi:hypothetical protein